MYTTSMIIKWIKQYLEQKKKQAFKEEAKRFSIFSGKVMMVTLLLASVVTYFAVTYIELDEHVSTVEVGEGAQEPLPL